VLLGKTSRVNIFKRYGYPYVWWRGESADLWQNLLLRKLTNKLLRVLSLTSTQDIVIVVKFWENRRGGLKFCIVKWQHNSEEESRLDYFLDQYQERAVRNQLRQLTGQLSRLTRIHFNTYLNFYTFILLMCTLTSDLISEYNYVVH